MKVSWDWLKQYVDLPSSHEDVADRLTMVGLNHESTEIVDGDPCIDFEVTSNRSDCLGHIGIAREIAAVFEVELRVPEPKLAESTTPTSGEVGVQIEPHAACSHYTARVIRGVKVGPSPAWLVRRLQTIGLKSINNVVDVTNYVMMECGQPLHAFDRRAIQGREIIVRSANAEESFEGIDHQTYKLSPGMCVIADEGRVIGLAGIMGSVNSEIVADTTEVVIEAAAFDHAAVRQASRAIKLRTDASHRFEKALDPAGVAWASDRCCELLLQVAGGELLSGRVEQGAPLPTADAIELRMPQFERLIGISIETSRAIDILRSLGCEVTEESAGAVLKVQPPSWRRDLTREVDLLEELARIHGYDRIPEKGKIGMSVVVRPPRQVALERVRKTLACYGLDESFTSSLVPAVWEDWSGIEANQAPLRVQQGMEGVLDRGMQAAGAVDQLRRSLLPSLVEARRINEFRGSRDAELFEMAKVYWPVANSLPREPFTLAWVMGNEFPRAKGIWESICAELSLVTEVESAAPRHPAFHSAHQATFAVQGQAVGTIGVISDRLMQAFHLREPVVLAEFDLDQVLALARLERTFNQLSPYPSVARDFNFVLGEAVRWSDLHQCVQRTRPECIESIDYRETFRAPDKDGADQKRVLLSVTLRAPDRTLDGDEVEQICQAIVTSVGSRVGGRLLA
ncbi:MAG: phenylalanine--tRNA ligase subunit beta [Pirellulaceae bacterium]